jgi:hypothetical protein
VAVRRVAEVTPEDLVDYLTAYRQTHGGAHATAEKIHRQLRHFAVWLREQQGIGSLDRPPLTTFTVPALLESSPPSKDDEGGAGADTWRGGAGPSGRAASTLPPAAGGH